MAYTVIDLFAGAGELTMGFHLARLQCLCAINFNKKALTTYKHNYPVTRIVYQDIRTINPKKLRLSLGLQRKN